VVHTYPGTKGTTAGVYSTIANSSIFHEKTVDQLDFRAQLGLDHLSPETVWDSYTSLDL
jgi:hypothetical protein